jgi:Bacterial alpha-L-rhamnosidase 6 hairpin glycosidase domain
MFRKYISVLAVLFTLVAVPSPSQQRAFMTPYYSLTLAPDSSAIESLSVDSLGNGEFRPSALFPPLSHPSSQAAAASESQNTAPNPAAWQFSFSQQSFQMVSTYHTGVAAQPMVLRFDPAQTHATLLALVNNGQARLPAVLHLPEMGSLRITVASRLPVALLYEAHRSGHGYVRVVFPGATLENPRVSYTLAVVSIHPALPGAGADPRFDGFRRNWLNIFQVQAEDGVLANNSASDPCGFTLHFYSEVAKYTPPLTDGLTAMDLIRMSLDRYLSGALACGMPYYVGFDAGSVGPNELNTVTSDTDPSFLIAAGDYIDSTHDTQWLTRNYQGLRHWTEEMLATDTNGDGLIKYSASGNSGSWPPRPDGGVALRPSNWWDTIGFGYEDAYSNALAYRALLDMSALAQLAHRNSDSNRYRSRAAKLRAAYLSAFFDPATGVIAGWRSQDGKLHDYYFPWVSGAAVVYGLVPSAQGNAIFDRLLAKMKEVGYTDFEHGIPGNLIPVRKEDYVDHHLRFGGGVKDDGSDGFQIYENGSATAAFAYYTIAALYKLGRTHDGDAILFPMLKSYKSGAFEGRGPNGMSYDWQSWDGKPSGYEGFLADCFMALAAVEERPKGQLH